MTKEILKYMNLRLKKILPYQYYEWKTAVEYPYWIGEYSEVESDSEDGFGEDVLMVTGTTTGSVIELEDGKEVLQRAFPKISGHHAVLESGTNIIVYYDTSTSVPTDNNDIKRIQVNLKIKSWKVSE